MLLTDARNRLRVDLSDIDVDSILMSDDTLDRAVQRAVSDLSRFLPLDSTYEITLIWDVTNAPWTSAAAAGTYVSLAHKPIKYQSETVKNNAGTVCARDTDYYMDYMSGKITHISGGAIGDAEECTITYKKSPITLDLTSILSNLIRVDRVEYPVGDVPQSFVSYDIYKNFLTITSQGMDSQASLAEKKHVLVYYKAKHTVPTPSAEGSYLSFLDDTVIMAASAYALYSLAIKYEIQAITDFGSARTALGNVAAILVDAETALDAAATALAAATTALGSTKVDDFLSGAEAPSAKKYLDDGDAFINTVTIGDNVPEIHALYAQRSTDIAIAFIQQAREYNTNANGYSTEAASRETEVDGYLNQADRYITVAMQNVNLAVQLRAEATDRRNETWAIWRDPAQYLGDFDISPVRQIASS